MGEFSVIDLKRVLIFGNNEITSELMRLLSSKGIEVSFLSTYGKFRYRIVPETTKNIFLRMAQHANYHNNSFRVSWSQTIVEAKIKNQRNYLLRAQKNQPDTDINEEINILKIHQGASKQKKLWMKSEVLKVFAPKLILLPTRN